MKKKILLWAGIFYLSTKTALFGLTSGPNQPEYSGFTPSTAEGLVDLLTGDFTYSLPLMNIPGPSLNLPLTLGYRSGIQLEQEASWVGLGWNLSTGAIKRNVNRYPDDYLRGRSNAHLESGKVTGWDVSVGIQVAGIGASVSFGQRSDQGGRFGVDLHLGPLNFDIAKYNARDKWENKSLESVIQNSMSEINFYSLANTALSKAYSHVSNQAMASMGINPAIVNTALNAMAGRVNMGKTSIGFNSTSLNSGAFHSENHSFFFGIKIGNFVQIGISYSNYAYWIYKHSLDHLYGYLYLNEMKEESATEKFLTNTHKMEYSYSPSLSRKELLGINDLYSLVERLHSFPMSTPDHYSLRAEGISTSFRPFHQEIGDYFGMDRHETPTPGWLVSLKKKWWSGLFGIRSRLEEKEKEASDWMNARVGAFVTRFVKEDSEIASAYGSRYPLVHFRETGAPGGTFLAENWRFAAKTTDAKPQDALSRILYRLRENDANTTGDDWWYSHPYLPTWDDDLKKVVYYQSGNSQHYIEIPDRICAATGIFPIFKESYGIDDDMPNVPEKALIGFTVVRPDGMVYEFHQPVFMFMNKVYSHSKFDNDKNEREYDYIDLQYYNQSTTMERAYAHAWLLTAMKSPDYLDMGTSGVTDEDRGGWIRFEYNHHIPSYHYRTPYTGLTPVGTGEDIITNKQDLFESYGQASWGVKEIYYLTDIFTKTHHAQFNLSDRRDSKEARYEEKSFSIAADNNGIYLFTNYLFAEMGDVLYLEFYYPESCSWIDSTNRCTADLPLAIFKGNVTVLDCQYVNGTVSRENGGKPFRRIYIQTPPDFPAIAPNSFATIDQSECCGTPSCTTGCGSGCFYVSGGFKSKVIKFADRNPEPKLQKIDNIKLFTRTVTKDQTGSYIDDDLVKEVKFTYASDCSNSPLQKELCPGIPNVYGTIGTVGKLTLRKVEFGDGRSWLPPYMFNYYMEGEEAPYDRFDWDRWGYYKHDGGHIPTRLGKDNVTDWNKMLQILQDSQSVGHTLVFSILHKYLNQDEINVISTATDEKSLLPRHKNAIGEVIDALCHQLNLIENYYASFSIPGNSFVYHMILGPEYSKYPKSAQMWNTYFKHTSPLLLDPETGTVKNNGIIEELDSNSVFALNMCALSEYVFLDPLIGIPQNPVTDKDRVVMVHLDPDRFDHNTNPDDVKAWSLKTITLPSGAKVDIEYESDDYTFVGRTRAVLPAIMQGYGSSIGEVVSRSINRGNDPSDLELEGMGYFKNITMEKDLNINISMLQLGQWRKIKPMDKFTLSGNKRFDDIPLRASSVFRIYRNVSDDPNNPDWQLNPDFEKIKNWQNDPDFNGNPPSDKRMHLIALFDPMDFETYLANIHCQDCGSMIGKTASGKAVKSILPIPIDLGYIETDFVFPESTDFATVTEYHDSIAKVACQSAYVDFTMSRLKDPHYWQYRPVQDSDWDHDMDDPAGECDIYAFYGAIDPTCSGGDFKSYPNAQYHFQYSLAWARKMNVGLNNDEEIQGKTLNAFDYTGTSLPSAEPLQYDMNDNSIDYLANIGQLNYCYKIDIPDDDNGQIYNGLLAWQFLEEYGMHNLDIANGIGDPGPFEQEYWDYYSINYALKENSSAYAGIAPGKPGGGVRVKKLAFNTGWPQVEGTVSNTRIVEYAYVSEGENGDFGGYSSGATPSEPPPYNNKGDDRSEMPPQVDIVKGAPDVMYGTVYEMRPGRGRVVYNHLTCSDVDDFMVDDSANYYIYDEDLQQYRLVKGAYDVDGIAASAWYSENHRWRTHRCAHFQGLPISEKKYDTHGNLVASKNNRYLTSLSKDELCALELIGFINSIDSRIKDVLIPHEDLRIFAGTNNDNFRFLKHHLSQYMGKTVERIRHRWINYDPSSTNGVVGPNQVAYFYSDGYKNQWPFGEKASYYNCYGIDEMEIVQHSIHQYSVRQLQYAGEAPQYGKGVGTTSINSYFDFYTGQPLVTTTMEAKAENPVRCDSDGSLFEARCTACGNGSEGEEYYDNSDQSVIPSKTTVTVPAYWMKSIQGSDDYSGMGPAFLHTDFFDAIKGNSSVSVENLLNDRKNMLAQTYSQSIYSGLSFLCCCKKCVPDSQIPSGMTRQQYSYVRAQQWHDKLNKASDEKYTLFKRNYTLWSNVGDETNRMWRITANKELRAPMDKTTQKLSTQTAPPDMLRFPYEAPGTLGELYICTEKNTLYDPYGHVLETMDANGNYSSSFYNARYHNVYKTGIVLNADRNSCRVLTVDELAEVPKLSDDPVARWGDGWENTTAAIVNYFARSGEYSFDLSTGQIILTLPDITHNKPYELSFWIRTAENVKVEGFGTPGTMPAYRSSGPEWQRIVLCGDAPSSSIVISADKGYCDDIRFIPQDAHAFTMTVNSKGWITSVANENDVITYFTYDAFGRLIETKDQQGVLISTQSQHEGKQ